MASEEARRVASRKPGGSGPRVGFIVGFFHSFDGDVGVDLGGTEAGMTEQ